MYFIKEYFLKIKDTYYSACFSSTYTKTGMMPRILAWPLLKDDMQICEVFHIKKKRQIHVTCIYHHSIIQNNVTALKIFCALPIHLPSPHSLATTDIFTVYMVLLFPECHSWGNAVCSLFRLVHLVSSMSFHSLMAHLSAE